MSSKLVLLTEHLILCHPLFLLHSIFPSMRVFSNQSVFPSGGQSIGASASASVLPKNIQGSLFSSVQSLSHVRLFTTSWTAACHASLSITNSQNLLKLMFIKLMIPPNSFVFCLPLCFLPLIFPSIGVFYNKSVLPINWTD